jgi:hypothetical protein
MKNGCRDKRPKFAGALNFTGRSPAIILDLSVPEEHLNRRGVEKFQDRYQEERNSIQ